MLDNSVCDARIRRDTQPRWTSIALVAVFLLATTLFAGVRVTGRIAPAAASDPGGQIYRSEVISRAQYWYDRRADIPYNSGGSYADPDGRYYRTDCSGYISMAWHLADQVNTASLPSVAHRISKDELEPGDVLNAAYGAGNYDTGHVAMFVRWTSGAHTSYMGYEFGQTPIQYHEIPYPYFANDPRTFLPYRYNNIIDDPVSSGASVFENGEYHVFGIKRSSGVLYQDTYGSSGWTGWQSLGGTVAGTPAVTYHDGRFDVFALSPGGHMFQKTYTSSSGWGDWHQIGDGVFGSGTGVGAVYENGEYHVFGISPGGGLFQDTYRSGGWTGWQSLGGTISGTPAVTYHDGRFDVFTATPGGHMFQIYYTAASGWSSWRSVDADGVFGSGTGAGAVYENGEYHVFGISPGGGLFQDTYRSGGWTGWQSLGGTVAGTPAVTYHDGRFDVFAMSPGATMFQKTYTTSSGWSDWHSIGGDFS